MSPAFENSDLMKTSPIMPCSVPCSLQGCLLSMLRVPYCCGWATCAFSPVFWNGSLCLLQIGFSPYVVNGPVRGYLESDEVFVRDAVSLNCRVLSLCCPLRSFCWWVESTVRPCLTSTHCWGCSGTGMRGCLPLFVGQELLWSGAAPAGAACTFAHCHTCGTALTSA